MQRTLLKSKLHRVRVTASELEYEGSCAIDENLLDAADIREYERIEIYNVNNGERFATYAIRGQRGSGMISVNGAAARKAAVGDILIIASYATYNEIELANFEPTLIYVDDKNRIKRIGAEIPAQAALSGQIRPAACSPSKRRSRPQSKWGPGSVLRPGAMSEWPARPWIG